MPRSYWCIGIAAVSLSLGYPVDRADCAQPSTEQSQNKPENRADPAPLIAVQNQLDRIAIAIERSQDNPDADDEKKRAENDLAAQQGMEKWAFWMFMAAAVSTILSVIGVFLIWRTLFHTRRAADAAWDAVEDTNIATKAMLEANEIANNAQRPWVSISVEITSIRCSDLHASVYYRVAFRNIGNFAAENVNAGVEIKLLGADFDTEIPKEFSNFSKVIVSQVTLLPQEEIVLDGKKYLDFKKFSWFSKDEKECSHCIVLPYVTYYYGTSSFLWTFRPKIVKWRQSKRTNRYFTKEMPTPISQVDIIVEPVAGQNTR